MPPLRRAPQLLVDLARRCDSGSTAPCPSRFARSQMISASDRASPGGSTALLIFWTRPSALQTTPSSSSCMLPAKTTSAWCAVSERKKSMTPKNSSFDSASRVKFASGSETSGLKHIEKSALISPRWIASMISTAPTGPAPGQLLGLDAPDAERRACGRSGSVIERMPGQLVGFLPVLASALPVALPGDHHAARALAAEVAGREIQVEHREAVLDALGMMLDAARVEAHRAIGLADPVRRLLDIARRDAGDPRGAIGRPVAAPMPPPHPSRSCARRCSRCSPGRRARCTCSIARNNARSVPGRTGRYRSALRVIGVMRGSTTMSLPPRSRHCHRY